ncbi:MAG: AAA family ATPase [Candidatus Shapirobacteria bacterium]|jgi:predicted kinase
MIVVSGLSCTGKSTLAGKISKEFSIPYFSKDMFKELLFDELGYSDRDWSKKMGGVSYKILYQITENLLKTGRSLVLESNFKPEIDRQMLLDLQKKYPFRVIEILCFADGKILFERFKKRAESGLRHPGHVDRLCYSEQEKVLMAGKAGPLGVGELIEVDTTDFEKVNYDGIMKCLTNMLDSSNI